jgi:hypothetical protein
VALQYSIIIGSVNFVKYISITPGLIAFFIA